MPTVLIVDDALFMRKVLGDIYSGRVCLDQYQALAKVIKFILHASLLFSVRAASPKYTSAGFL
ncbi:MAG: hypothetical protein PHW69_08460, partial [Elusimicrobiaceae bacterium]|nr:hypothetical protein [Elusimicrobiaceae bacterium]